MVSTFHGLPDSGLQVVALLEVDVDEVIAPDTSLQRECLSVDIDTREARAFARLREQRLCDVLEVVDQQVQNPRTAGTADSIRDRQLQFFHEVLAVEQASEHILFAKVFQLLFQFLVRGGLVADDDLCAGFAPPRWVSPRWG